MILTLALATTLAAADPPKTDRAIGKEPAYKSKQPRYLLLAFGPDGRDRVWLVQDGDTLFVDRNGNGDLTDPGEAVAADKPRPGTEPTEGAYGFTVGDVTAGRQTHKDLRVAIVPLSEYANGELGSRADVKAVLAADPKATVARVSADVAVAGLKGGGAGGRVSFLAGPVDLEGVLRFGPMAATAPVVRLGGPLAVTFYGDRPTPRVGRSEDLMLVVGAPGEGPGTFAMIQYDGTIPESAYPVAEVTFPAAKAGDPPFRERHELKKRC